RAGRGTPDEGGLDRPRRRPPLLREARRHRRARSVARRDPRARRGERRACCRADPDSDRDRRRAATAAPDRARNASLARQSRRYAGSVPELPEGERIRAGLERERVTPLDRRGKYLVVRFETGRVLLIHLRMTGSLRVLRNEDDDPY